MVIDVEITEWQRVQITKVAEQRLVISEKEDLLIKTILDSKGIDLNTVQSANLIDGKLMVTLKT